MKKLWQCNNVICQQCDGISMGSSLAPVLANIILTEFEKSCCDAYHEKWNLKILW